MKRMLISVRTVARALAFSALTTHAVSAAARPPQPPRPAPARHEASSSSAGVVVGLAAGLLVIGGLALTGVLLARRPRRARGDGRAPERLVAARTHDWEMVLDIERENALLRGVEAYRDAGHSLYLAASDAMLYLYEPRRIVSLYLLAHDFLGAGPAAVADPAAVVRRLLDSYVAAESAGVLHLQEGWYGAPVDGLDAAKFTSLCYDLLSQHRPDVSETHGSGSDDKSGLVYLHVAAGAPMNTFCVDLGRLLASVRAARLARPSAPLADLVRPLLLAMSQGQMLGAIWTREPVSASERAVLGRIAASPLVNAA